MSLLKKDWEKRANAVNKILRGAGIEYTPAIHFYTYAGRIPKSIIEKNSDVPNMDLSDYHAIIYIHIPFCTRKCSFCPFFSVVSQAVPDAYVDALVAEIGMLSQKNKLPSRYTLDFGGGSPNLLSIGQLTRILSAFEKSRIAEIRFEMHPGSIKDEKYIAELKSLGVNRFSIGLQTTDCGKLACVNRGHGTKEFEAAISWIQKTRLPHNVDMIFGGFADETMESVQNDFSYVFSKMKPDFVTAYQMCLTLGTPERQNYLSDTSRFPKSDMIMQMRALVQQSAEDCGYSYIFDENFVNDAKHPGYIGKMRVAQKIAILGIGPGTFSYVNDLSNKTGRCWYSFFDLAAYIACVSSGNTAIDKSADLGIDYMNSFDVIAQLKAKGMVGIDSAERIPLVIAPLVRLGLLRERQNHFEFTKTGRLLENLICCAIHPKHMWQELAIARKQEGYDGRYDLFFEPEPVLKFIDFLENLNPKESCGEKICSE